jgi:hypothetical protein
LFQQFPFPKQALQIVVGIHTSMTSADQQRLVGLLQGINPQFEVKFQVEDNYAVQIAGKRKKTKTKSKNKKKTKKNKKKLRF